ncbi:pilus assembly protein TadG-related protein [Sphingomonas daechungensis]|uniref:pilus assembly protein TadG-related protein n=1 Tax=Sphingomonas daechungensis TaxID=1176646 RepID=UPI0031F02B6B
MKATLGVLLNDERGNVLALAAVGLPIMLGCAALAVDTVQWVFAKRELQSTADAAAIAGVYGLIQTGDMETAVDRSISANQSLDRRRSVSAEQSPAPRDKDPFAVRVRLATPASMTFTSLFLSKPPVISVEAIATVVENGDYCLFALDTEQETGLKVEPSSSVEMDCGMATNASSKDAISAEGSASLKADMIAAFGGIEAEGISSSRVRAYGVKQKDPFADRDPPLVPNTGCPNVTVNSDDSNGNAVVLPAGCYGNMLIDGKVILADGQYILNRGNMVIGSSAEVTCRACTIFLTSEQAATDPWSVGKIQIDNGAKVKLHAPTQGPNAGLLIYQDRRSAGAHDEIENVIGGNSFSEFKGLIYFPSETVRIDADKTPDLQCARFIGRKLIVKGRVLIAKGCSDANVMNFKGTEVRLIG